MVNKSFKGFLNLFTAAIKIEIFAMLVMGMLIFGYAVSVSYTAPTPPIPEKSPEPENKEYFYT